VNPSLFRVLVVAIGVLTGSQLQAADAPHKELPWAVRGEAFLLSGSGIFGATAGSMAATVRRNLWERFAWEETVGWGAGNRRVDGQDIGFTLAGTLRFAPWTTSDRTHALTLGLGSALILGGGYGTLNFVFGELGYEYRASGGFTLIATAGPNLLVSKPSVSICGNQAWFCQNFRRGDFASLGHFRVGAGWAF
jgi:hypothetical protein